MTARLQDLHFRAGLREQRTLVVADRDFGELIFRQALAHAGVLFFRLPGAPLPTKLDHLTAVLESHAEALVRGEFLVVTPARPVLPVILTPRPWDG